jgi:hypothetical protein
MSSASSTEGIVSIWDGSDDEGFHSLDHPGYSEESDPENFTGGWRAYRKCSEDLTLRTEEDGVVAVTGEATSPSKPDWIHDEVKPFITKFDYSKMEIGRSPRILVLYGSLRPTSYSRSCAYEFARLLGKNTIQELFGGLYLTEELF